MSNQQHPMMGMFPFPMGGFMMPQQQPQQQVNDMVGRVPSRVAVAMQFLGRWMEHMHIMPAIAESDSTVEIDQIPGLAIDEDNKKVRKAACDLLEQFFNGSYVTKEWELNQDPKINERGAAVVCVACGGAGVERGQGGKLTEKVCQLCMGAKNVLIFPYSGMRVE